MPTVRNNILEYFDYVGHIMTGMLHIARTFVNASNIGATREAAYLDFLKRSLPSKLCVTFGGYLFDRSYNGSPQVDIIVSSENAFRFGLATPNSDTAIVRAEDALAVVECKSIMKGRISYRRVGAGNGGVNENSEIFTALNAIRSTKIIAGRARLVGVLFALDWEGVANIVDAADDILLFVQTMAARNGTSLQDEFLLLPDVIHIHNRFVVFRLMRGDKYCGMTFDVEGVDEGILVGLEKPYINSGFALVCGRISERALSTPDHLYSDLTEAYVHKDLEASGVSIINSHWISCRPLWEGVENSASDFHNRVEVTATSQ